MSFAMRDILLGIGCVIVCFLPGIFGSQFQPGPWYESLQKPLLTPPGWAFPVAWTILYLLMGVALLVVVRRENILVEAPEALVVFAVQLLLNGLWSWLFFGLQRPALAFFEISVLWCLIAASVVLFWRISVLAGALLLPYLFWVGFASWLNFGLWRLNHG